MPRTATRIHASVTANSSNPNVLPNAYTTTAKQVETTQQPKSVSVGARSCKSVSRCRWGAQPYNPQTCRISVSQRRFNRAHHQFCDGVSIRNKSKNRKSEIIINNNNKKIKYVDVEHIFRSRKTTTKRRQTTPPTILICSVVLNKIQDCSVCHRERAVGQRER